MNRAARRRANRAAKRLAKSTPASRVLIIEKHWRDEWHFTDAGLIVRDKITRRTIAFYPGALPNHEGTSNGP